MRFLVRVCVCVWKCGIPIKLQFQGMIINQWIYGHLISRQTRNLRNDNHAVYYPKLQKSSACNPTWAFVLALLIKKYVSNAENIGIDIVTDHILEIYQA